MVMEEKQENNEDAALANGKEWVIQKELHYTRLRQKIELANRRQWNDSVERTREKLKDTG